MEMNGHFLISKRTKHIKMRYFLIKYKVYQGDIEIRYCPEVSPLHEDRICSDILTKPKLGRAFLNVRSILVNFHLWYVDDNEHKDIDKVSGSEKPESYVWMKREGILHKPSYSHVTMKSNTHFLQSSLQECVGGVLKQ